MRVEFPTMPELPSRPVGAPGIADDDALVQVQGAGWPVMVAVDSDYPVTAVNEQRYETAQRIPCIGSEDGGPGRLPGVVNVPVQDKDIGVLFQDGVEHADEVSLARVVEDMEITNAYDLHFCAVSAG